MKQSNPAKGVKWDLTHLYEDISDGRITIDKDFARKEIANFNKQYKGKLNILSAKEFIQMLKTYEKIVLVLGKLGEYGYLQFAKDKASEKIRAFYQNMTEFLTEVDSQLLWLSLEINEIPDKAFKVLLKDQELEENYGYYLSSIRKFREYLLTESEEKIVTEKDATGESAFSRLYEEIAASQKFEFTYKGKTEILSVSEIRTVLDYSLDREKRKAAATAYTETLKNSEHIYTFILNTLLYDRIVERRLRKYEYPMQNAYLNNDTPKEIVDALEQAVTKNYDIGELYYEHKSELMNLEQLHEWDRYAQIFDSEDEKVSWKEAVDMVLKAFHKFDKEYGQVAEKFFNENWIDAELSEGKSHGAFCTHGTPESHPYILINYTGTLRDVMTLAHELGHGIHHWFSRSQNYLNFASGVPVAEIASVFGESLVFDSLLDKVKDSKGKISLLAGKIEDDMATVLRQMAFHLIEQELNTTRKDSGELGTEQINQIWQNHLQKMFGKSLILTEGHKYWWMPVMHFYHFDFYVYSYSFGQLLTLALYAKYKTVENKEIFITNYKKVLTTGGSMSPKDLLNIMGFDISDKHFWDNGMQILRDYVEEFRTLELN